MIEVLSPSTEVYDRSTKLEHYKTIETLREIALVAQDHTRVDLLRRVEQQWLWLSYVKSAVALRLDSLDREIPMTRTDAKTNVPEEPSKLSVVEEG